MAMAAGWLGVAAGGSSAPRIVSADVPVSVSANNEYVIQFSSRSAQRAQATDQLESTGVELEPLAPKLFISLATMTPEEAQAAASAPGVVAVDPNDQISAAATQPNPPWGLDRTDQTDLPLDSSVTYSDSAGAGTTIYILDSGINAAHTEFTGRLAPGANFMVTPSDANTNDCYGHGTHVAGTAAGTTYGLAKLATIVPVRVLDCGGNGSLETVLGGINWVINNHVSGRAVANLSLGGDAAFPTLDNAIAALVADGVAVAVAAGNLSTDACNASPARAPAALTVGASTAQDVRAYFSDFGPCVDLFAPGSNVVSAWINSPNATKFESGTSMAAPHVAGALAVLWTDNPSLTATQVEAVLVATATPGRLSQVGGGSPNLLLHLGPPLNTIKAAATGIVPADRCAFSSDC